MSSACGSQKACFHSGPERGGPTQAFRLMVTSLDSNTFSSGGGSEGALGHISFFLGECNVVSVTQTSNLQGLEI